MLKYVLKRLGLSVIVLLGVSVIIYFLVRLMPTNYLENKFSAQIQQGTITLDQLDDFQKRYGLYMPEAYVSVDIDGYDTFEKDAKEKKYQDAQNEIITYAEFYAGKYTNKKDFVLELNKEGTYRIYKQDGDTVTEEKSGRISKLNILNVRNLLILKGSRKLSLGARSAMTGTISSDQLKFTSTKITKIAING